MSPSTPSAMVSKLLDGLDGALAQPFDDDEDELSGSGVRQTD